MTNFVYVYITNPTKEEAKSICKHLIDKKLIACGNIIGPIENIYPWEGKLVDEEGYILIAKTKEDNFERVKDEVEKIHSDTIPCIAKIPVSSNQKYFNWLMRELE